MTEDKDKLSKVEKSSQGEKNLSSPKVEAKVEAKKAEAKVEAPKTEAKVEAKVEAKKAEATKAEAKKTEAKVEAKVEAPKAEAKVEAPKAEAPKTEAKKAEAKVEAPKAEAKKTEAKVEAPKAEAKKTEAKKAEAKVEATKTEAKAEAKKELCLNGLFAFKMSMSTFYNDKGENIPVTALKYEPCFVSQIKTKEKDSYEAVQVSFKAQKNKRCSKALIQHLKPAGFKEGARFVREIRQSVPEALKPGAELSINSIKKGDLLKISSFSKGRGFSGVMKKWNFAGGKSSHGSKSHRRIGSIGQHTEPARVMPGRKMPGQYGFKKVSRLKVPVVDVFPKEGIIFVKGPVPGARNTLVSLQKTGRGN